MAHDRREPEGDVTEIVRRNVETIADLRARSNLNASSHAQRLAALIHVIGRPVTLYTVIGFALAWAAVNVVLQLTVHRAFDPPPFAYLELIVSVAALVTSITVLIGQNRQGRINEHRSELDLQMNILAEQRTAKLIELVEELRRDLPNVHNRGDAEAAAMARSADPAHVAEVVEQTLSEVERRTGGGEKDLGDGLSES